MSNPFELDNQNYFSILNSHRNVESLYTVCKSAHRDIIETECRDFLGAFEHQ